MSNENNKITKVEIEAKVLKSILPAISKACTAKHETVDAITSHIYFSFKADSATLLGYDDVKHFAIKGTIPVISNQEGDYLVESKMLNSILGKIQGTETIKLEFSENKVIIRVGKSRFTMNCRNAAAFPKLPIVQETSKIVLSGMQFRNAIANTNFAVSTSATNGPMLCQHLQKVGDTLTVTALNGYLIAKNKIKGIQGEDFSVLLRGALLKSISGLISEDDIVLKISNNFVVIESNNLEITIQRNDGNFPDFDKIFINDFPNTLELKTKEFLEAVDKSMLFVQPGEHKPLVLTITKDNLNLNIKTTAGELNDDIEAKAKEDLVIAFNPQYLVEILKCIKEDTLSMSFTNNISPAIFKGDNYSFVLLPVRTGA